jgi:hypothetical protein
MSTDENPDGCYSDDGDTERRVQSEQNRADPSLVVIAATEQSVNREEGAAPSLPRDD